MATVNKTLRLDENLVEALIDKSKDENRSFNNMVESILLDRIKEDIPEFVKSEKE